MKHFCFILCSAILIFLKSGRVKSAIPEQAKEFASILFADAIFMVDKTTDTFEFRTAPKQFTSGPFVDKLTIESKLFKNKKEVQTDVDEYTFTDNWYFIKALERYVGPKKEEMYRYFGGRCETALERNLSRFNGVQNDCTMPFDDRSYNVYLNCTHLVKISIKNQFVLSLRNRKQLPANWRPAKPPCPV